METNLKYKSDSAQLSIVFSVLSIFILLVINQEIAVQYNNIATNSWKIKTFDYIELSYIPIKAVCFLLTLIAVVYTYYSFKKNDNKILRSIAIIFNISSFALICISIWKWMI